MSLRSLWWPPDEIAVRSPHRHDRHLTRRRASGTQRRLWPFIRHLAMYGANARGMSPHPVYQQQVLERRLLRTDRPNIGSFPGPGAASSIGGYGTPRTHRAILGEPLPETSMWILGSGPFARTRQSASRHEAAIEFGVRSTGWKGFRPGRLVPGRPLRRHMGTRLAADKLYILRQIDRTGTAAGHTGQRADLPSQTGKRRKPRPEPTRRTCSPQEGSIEEVTGVRALIEWITTKSGAPATTAAF